jgi:hypothetical protein
MGGVGRSNPTAAGAGAGEPASISTADTRQNRTIQVLGLNADANCSLLERGIDPEADDDGAGRPRREPDFGRGHGRIGRRHPEAGVHRQDEEDHARPVGIADGEAETLDVGRRAAGIAHRRQRLAGGRTDAEGETGSAQQEAHPHVTIVLVW